MYDLSEEQEIVRAVAMKVNANFADAGLNKGESFFEAQKAYNDTLKQRAMRFLKDLEEKIDALSNQEVADLLRVLLANGTIIESEEELEYYIALLERIAMQRVARGMEQFTNSENPRFPDSKGFLELIDALKIAHLRKQPKDRKSDVFKKWQETARHFDMAKKLVRQTSKKENRQLKSRRKEGGSRQEQENDSGNDKSRDDLIGKMVSAGVPPNGPYWNDILAGYEGATDKADFVAKWTVDEQRRDEEKKDQNQNERQEPEKEKTEPEKKPEKSDQEKIDELRMGKQQQNEEKINQEFQNPGNIKAVQEVADKKLEKTGKELTDKDIKIIKTKMIGGR